MATAFAALASLHNNLALIRNHPRHSFSFDGQQIDSLWEQVGFLIHFMKRIDNYSHGDTKGTAEAFQRLVAGAAHAAEDLIESHVVDQIRAGSTLSGKTTSRFLLDLRKATHDMSHVTEKAFIVYKKKAIDAEQPTIPAAVDVATTSPIPLPSQNNKMVGFDDQLIRLLDLLTGEPRSSRRVISIAGMGGIGKTTLATNAFQHSYIVHYFDVCLWATVSPEFSVQKILTQLLSQIKDKTPSSSVSSVGEGLRKSLYGRRYLIVLDDMWSVEAWDEMKFFFPDTSNGSRIVVTTRQSHVATQLGSLKFNVRFLDEESSWDLFCGKTFGDEGCPPELEDLGKRIVKNCGGLPLSIVVVGGWLQNSSRKREYWENIANDMISVLDSGENEQCLNVLSLSYRYLPVHLKPCFLFLGVFPKDEEISLNDLISLWIGEGFILQYNNLSLEEVAKSFIRDLINRWLISVYKDLHGSWKCKVHDLLRELCLKIAKKEEFLSVCNPQEAINRKRRVVMIGKIPEVNHQPKTLHAPSPRSASIVRSLICEGGQLSFDSKLLRVLNGVESELVNEIYFQQLNLRYLKVDVGYMSYLPSSISLLWNLQTLIITGVYRLIIAPYEIWEMLQLRRIEINSLSLVDPLPIEGLDQGNDQLVLENLHTLSVVENFRLSEEVCRRIPNIRELNLFYIGGPSSYYCLNNLGCFQKLDLLRCFFNLNADLRGFVSSLTFPASLTQLHLSGCRLGWDDLSTEVGCFPHLRVLELCEDSVCGSEWTPDEGGFPCLKHLTISKCDLIHWNADESHFPVLQDLYLISLSELDEFPSAVGEIPTLVNIFLRHCSVPSSFSAMRMVVEQKEQGNEGILLFVGFKCDEENTLEGFKQMAEEEGLTSKNILISD